MKKLKHLLITLVASLGLVAPVAVPAVVSAQVDINDNLCRGSAFDADGGADCAAITGDADSDINNIIETAINIFSLVVGIIAVVMIIIGGVKYITSGGDSGNVTGAKNTILYAVIGLVIVALAQIIVWFVLGGVDQGIS